VRVFALLIAAALLQAPQAPVLDAPQPFDQWLQALMAEARARGYSENLVQQALAGVEPLPRVIQNDRSQAELVVGFDRYYRSRVNAQVAGRGRELARQHRTVLTQIEDAYDVQRRFIVAIWGIETRYGRVTGSTPVFQALATLAWEPRRSDYFRGELFNALTIVSRGDIDAASMTGSWAGAMGHPQFMPSSYLKFAEDFDRDGHRDIWRSTPDALASIANYLKEWGWDDEFTWGREVRITPAVRARIEQETSKRTEGCFAMRNMTERIPLTTWQQLGVQRANGAALPASDIPAGLVDTDTRSFLVYPNYDAILRYNCAHYYALTVALLADQIR
jgi:peptidoglycan lytic transglycosylase B